jgi:hypothetical protein
VYLKRTVSLVHRVKRDGLFGYYRFLLYCIMHGNSWFCENAGRSVALRLEYDGILLWWIHFVLFATYCKCVATCGTLQRSALRGIILLLHMESVGRALKMRMSTLKEIRRRQTSFILLFLFQLRACSVILSIIWIRGGLKRNQSIIN